jgi:hypothetical protein
VKVAIAMLFAAGSQWQTSLPFAEGPAAQIGPVRAAAAKCRTIALFRRTAHARIAVYVDSGPGERPFDCLSRWIALHPEAGFEKFGFVGSETNHR